MEFEKWTKSIILENIIEDHDGVILESDLEEAFEEYLSETIQKKTVVRDGKPRIKYYSSIPGYKVVMVDGKPEERKVSSKEKLSRALGAKKAARKRRGQSKQSSIKRKRSIEARKRLGGN